MDSILGRDAGQNSEANVGDKTKFLTYSGELEVGGEFFEDEHGNQVEVQWKVTLYGIDWDDGDGEYDTSDLPQNVEVIVNGFDKADAIARALEEAGEDTYGFLIRGTHQIVARPNVRVVR